MATLIGTARSPLLEAAGPSRAPAALLHPTDEIPRKWRIVDTWEWRGQRGGWATVQESRWSRDEEPIVFHAAVQFVYRADAPRGRKAPQLSRILGTAARLGQCASRVADPGRGYFRGSIGSRLEDCADHEARTAHYAAAGVDIEAIDQAADERARVEALADDPTGEKHEDAKLIAGWAEWALRRAREHGGSVTRAMELFDAELSDGAKPWGQTIRPMVEARLRDALAANPEVPAPREPLGAAIGAAIEARIASSGLAIFVAQTAPRLLAHGRDHGAQAARDGNDRWRTIVAESQGEAFAAEVHKRMGDILDAAFGPAEPEWPDIPDVFRRAFEGEDR